MIIIFREDATEEQIQSALRKIGTLGYTPHLSRGAIIGLSLAVVIPAIVVPLALPKQAPCSPKPIAGCQ